jgi:hypothetical protein
MADYFSPTIVQPTIPIIDMTPLERLVLAQVFDAEEDGDGIYFSAESGAASSIALSLANLRHAVSASAGIPSTALDYFADKMPRSSSPDGVVEIDMSGTSIEFFLQDIVKRSATLNYVTVVSAFTCSKMRPDGFGGMAVVITADAIKGKSTDDIVNDCLDELGVTP